MILDHVVESVHYDDLLSKHEICCITIWSKFFSMLANLGVYTILIVKVCDCNRPAKSHSDPSRGPTTGVLLVPCSSMISPGLIFFPFLLE